MVVLRLARHTHALVDLVCLVLHLGKQTRRGGRVEVGLVWIRSHVGLVDSRPVGSREGAPVRIVRLGSAVRRHIGLVVSFALPGERGRHAEVGSCLVGWEVAHRVTGLRPTVDARLSTTEVLVLIGRHLGLAGSHCVVHLVLLTRLLAAVVDAAVLVRRRSHDLLEQSGLLVQFSLVDAGLGVESILQQITLPIELRVDICGLEQI